MSKTRKIVTWISSFLVGLMLAGAFLYLMLTGAVKAGVVYNNRKFEYYTAQEIINDPSKSEVFAYSFVVDKDAPFVILLPGGAYKDVCSRWEGISTAQKLNKKGINAFILNYRTAPYATAHNPQDDLGAFVKYIFDNKEALGVNNENYCVWGGSAGGHLAASFGTKAIGYEAYGVKKPQFIVLSYPVITMGEGTHPGSHDRFVGVNASDELEAAYSIQNLVTPDYPPTFMWYCEDDRTVNPEANAVVMDKALAENGVKHITQSYKWGGHGISLGYFTPAYGWFDDAIAFWKTFW